MDNRIERSADVASVNQILENKSIAGFQERLVEVQEHSSTLLRRPNDTILAQILAHFDPREAERIRGEVAIIKDELEQRKRILALYHDMQISVTKEFCDNLLIKIQSRNRADLTQHLLALFQAVKKDADRATENITREIEQQYVDIDKISNEGLRQIRMEKLEKETVRSFDFIERLLKQFEESTVSRLQVS